MPTRLLLEGGDLQELLAQVREEHGTRAKIVSAERVRAGGLTGLLRAERYELTVELSDDMPVDAPVPVGAAPSGAGPSGAPAPAVRAAQAPPTADGPLPNGTRTAAPPAGRQPGPAATPNGAPISGTPNGSASNGLASNGLASNGSASNGSASNGSAAYGAGAHGAATNGAAVNGAAPNGVPGNAAPANGWAANGAPTNGGASHGAAANGAAGNAGSGMVGNGIAAYGAAGNSMPGNAVANGIAGNGMATNGAVGGGMAGDAGRQATAPVVGGQAGTAEHGADVDELLALLAQREAATPDSSSVGGSATDDPQAGGPPAGFDEVLAELRGVGGPAIAATNGAAASGPANGGANGAANGSTNGATNGVANGTGHSSVAHSSTAPPQQAQPAQSNVQSAQTPPSAIHSAIESALPAVLRQESTPTSAETVEFAMDPIFAPAKGAPEAPPAPAAARATIPAPGTTARPAGHNQNGHAQPGHNTTGHTQAGHSTTGHTQTGLNQAGHSTTSHNQAAPPAPAQTGPAQSGAAQGASAQNGSAHGSSAHGSSTQNSASRATTSRSTANPARTRPLSPDPRRPNHFLSYGDLESIPTESPLPEKLADLGLPQRVIDRLPLGEAYPSIVRALIDEPDAPPLPSGPGMIITIIGELAGALAVAEDVARILRLDADRILIASESPQVGRHIADPGDAGRQAARLRGGDQPRLVCVDSPGPTSWVQQVVVALRPDAVWCAVDATRKPADVARQLRALPRVDALAVHQLEATADPASPLALGVPVALLDGQPAGPHGWAALLSRRLFEEEYSGGDR